MVHFDLLSLAGIVNQDKPAWLYAADKQLYTRNVYGMIHLSARGIVFSFAL
jgi:hypothetical protein